MKKFLAFKDQFKKKKKKKIDWHDLYMKALVWILLSKNHHSFDEV